MRPGAYPIQRTLLCARRPAPWQCSLTNSSRSCAALSRAPLFTAITSLRSPSEWVPTAIFSVVEGVLLKPLPYPTLSS